ncbi:MAG: apolipoprotein N-acyltransferase [bacterium]
MILKKAKTAGLVSLSVALAIFSHPTVLFNIHFPNLGFLAWFAYVPLFWVLTRRSPAQTFKIAFGFGFFFYLGSNYWLYLAMNQYGNLSPSISVLVLVILAVVLALYLSVAFVVASFVERRRGIDAFWVLPIAWVAGEWCRSHWPLGGFPWAQAAYSQAGYLPIIQISDVAGVYGVTALLICGNLFLLEIFWVFTKQKTPTQMARRGIFFCFLAFGVLIYGFVSQKRIEAQAQSAPKLKIGLIQADIPQGEKWLSGKADAIVRLFQSMTHQAIARGADLVIWPEASFPYDMDLSKPEHVRAVGIYPKELIAGAVTFDSGQKEEGASSLNASFPILNSAFLVKAGGELVSAYHKQHLVPYGEYIPLKTILPFLKKLTAQVGEFQTGSKFTLLSYDVYKAGALICYEDIFPNIARFHTKNGANLLVNLTNDAWYGDTSALPQHLSFSPFRAVENRRSLVRATNNGMTAMVGPTGKIEKLFPPFERGILLGEVSLMSSMSFYARFGDVFAYVCMGMTAVFILFSFARKRRSR